MQETYILSQIPQQNYLRKYLQTAFYLIYEIGLFYQLLNILMI